MSVATPQTPPVPPAPGTEREEITIVSHSNLLYWWPVWVLGYVLALLTAWDNHVMAMFPNKHFETRPDWVLKNDEQREGILVVPGKDANAKHRLPRDADDRPEQPHIMVSTKKSYGVLFVFVLLGVILITNVPLRGMWSLVVIMLIVLVSIILALAELWEPILRELSLLDIRINLAGYVTMATGLLIMWLLTFIFFDRQVYIKFTPGQLRVCTQIGGGEEVYDTQGMTVQKQRSDLFRHWILGLGSGDLIVKTAGAQAHQFDMQNVLFVGKKVAQIEEMTRKRSVIESKG